MRAPAAAVVALVAGLVAAGLAAALSGGAAAMSMGAPQPQCTQCHADAANRPAEFVVEGLPEQYEPGKVYTITVRITGGPDCPEGSPCGGLGVLATGGELQVVDDVTTQLTQTAEGPMLTHTAEGAKRREWTFAWRAPEAGEVTIRIAVIAANGDGSLTGDAYGYREFTLRPAAPATPAPQVTVVTREVVETRTLVTVERSPVTVVERDPAFAAAVAAVAFAVTVAAFLAVARARS